MRGKWRGTLDSSCTPLYTSAGCFFRSERLSEDYKAHWGERGVEIGQTFKSHFNKKSLQNVGTAMTNNGQMVSVCKVHMVHPD